MRFPARVEPARTQRVQAVGRHGRILRAGRRLQLPAPGPGRGGGAAATAVPALRARLLQAGAPLREEARGEGQQQQ